MIKWTRILTAVCLLFMAAGIAACESKDVNEENTGAENEGNEEGQASEYEPDSIEVLDGEGSYVVLVEGTVTDVSGENDKEYIVTLELDNDLKESLGEDTLRFLMEYDQGDPGVPAYNVGDEIWVNFPGAMNWEGDPKLITIIYDSGLNSAADGALNEDFSLDTASYDDILTHCTDILSADDPWEYKMEENDPFTAESRNIPISVCWLDEYDRGADTCEWVSLDESVQQSSLVIQAKEDVTDVKIYRLEAADVDDDGSVQYDSEQLYEQDKITADLPLGLDLTFAGDMSCYGISFTDPDGNEQEYILDVSGIDGSIQLRAAASESLQP